MRHRKIKPLLGAYYDGELKEKERVIVERHLEECEECRSELNFLKKIEEIIIDKKYEPGEYYWASFPERVKERISKKESEFLKKAKTSILKNIFLRPVSMKLAGVIASITIIVIVSIFYYELKLPFEIPSPEKKPVLLQKNAKSEELKKEIYSKEVPSFPILQQKDKEKEPTILSQEKGLSETKKGESQEKSLGLMATEEELFLERKEEMKIRRIPMTKSLSEETSEEEKIYQEGLRLQQEGRYDEALKNYQYILYNYPSGKRAPNAQFQINTISSFKLKKFNENSLRQIIKSWEKFIVEYPDSEFIPSAKRNLTVAYYQLAILTMNKEDIEKAINALKDFLKLPTDERDKFEGMLEELKKLK